MVAGEAVDAASFGSDDDAGDDPEASSQAVAASPADEPQSAAPSVGVQLAWHNAIEHAGEMKLVDLRKTHDYPLERVTG